jgi:hypothetical protein
MSVWGALERLTGPFAQGLWGWLQPKVQANLADYVFFRAVLQRLEHDVEALGSTFLGNVMQYVGYLALIVVTIWVLFQGYRIVTGQLRESAMAAVANMTKAVFIVSVALSFGGDAVPDPGHEGRHPLAGDGGRGLSRGQDR